MIVSIIDSPYDAIGNAKGRRLFARRASISLLSAHLRVMIHRASDDDA
jgi:hypothetical protein